MTCNPFCEHVEGVLCADGHHYPFRAHLTMPTPEMVTDVEIDIRHGQLTRGADQAIHDADGAQRVVDMITRQAIEAYALRSVGADALAARPDAPIH